MGASDVSHVQDALAPDRGHGREEPQALESSKGDAEVPLPDDEAQRAFVHVQDH